MNKDIHDIDNLFKQSIDDHLEEVPPDVWQNIDHGLDKKQAAFYKRRYFTVRAAAILLLLVGGVTIAAILRYHSSEKSTADETTVTNGTGKGVKRNQPAIERLPTGALNKGNEVVSVKKAVENKTAEKRTVVGKENSKEFATSENSTYSAEKNEEVFNGTGKRAKEKKQGVEVKPIVTAPSIAVEEGGGRQQAITSVSNGRNAGQEAVDRWVRTNYVDARVLDISEFTINNSLRDPRLTSVVAPGFASTAPPIAEKSRNLLGKWSVSPMYAQNINLNRLKDDDHFRDPRNNSREAKRTEQETKSFSLGLGIQKEIGRNVSLQTGLQYFSSLTTIKPKMIFAEPDNRGEVRYRFNCSSGDSYIPSKNGAPPMIGDSIRTNSSESSLSYFQVPLLASYRISFGKFSILPSAGIQANFLLNSKLTSSLVQPSGDEEFNSSIDGLRSVYFSGVVQPQLNYKLNDRISFDVNPNINFSLSPINKETAVKTYQNIFSVGAGLRIRL
jgi:hypothetical protein